MKHILCFLMMASLAFAVDYTIVTPYDSNEVWDIQYAQYDNSMYLVTPDEPPQLLTRTAHNAWTLTDLSTVIDDGPFMEDVTGSTTITASATTGSVTLTASSGIFDSGHVGSIWQISHQRESVATSGTFTGNGTSANSEFFTGQWSFVTNGAWRGTVSLERSEDLVDWEPYFTPLTNTNFANFEETEDDGAYYRVKMENWEDIPEGYENSPGNCDYTFTVLSQLNDGVVRITAYSGTTSVTATSAGERDTGAITGDGPVLSPITSSGLSSEALTASHRPCGSANWIQATHTASPRVSMLQTL
jgi:hypothetical protein